jgi:SlyX protein
MERRLVDLEVRYSYLERAIGDLDAVVLELRAQIDALRLQVKRLEDVAREEPGPTLPSEKPPHY